jgi:hypothetical protein
MKIEAANRVRLGSVLTVMACIAGRPVCAQTEYYNTDGGRPLRVEDATPTARYALDLHFPTARVERFDRGVSRLRVEPAFAYGILPRTALELRAAFVYREPAATPRAGMSGLGLGITHALNTETTWIPAIALGGEVYAPAGSARTGGSAYSLRTHVTRSWTLGRLHANATYGNYNVTVPTATPTACGPGTVPGPGGLCFTNVPFVPDGPCSVAPTASARCASNERSVNVRREALAATSPKRRGDHWVVGIGGDHALPLQSVLVMADVFGERYVGLFDRWDWTAELGGRHQLTPYVTIDASVGRRFAGVTRAWVFSGGLTRSMTFAPRAGVARSRGAGQ